jgi:hypothetical protein
MDQLIAIIQREYPNAGIRITGRSRTILRQAQLMAARIHANREEFLSTYANRQHIQEMNSWILENPEATISQTTTEFERIIRLARARGATVSNHLSDHARDISWPVGIPVQLDAIEARINALGGIVLREPDAAGGPHWHIDWE